MSEPLRLYCRKTKQPVLMRPDEACPHCGQIGHGADLTRLNAVISKLTQPLPSREAQR